MRGHAAARVTCSSWPATTGPCARFLQVLVEDISVPGADDGVLYASLHEPWRDWTDIATVTAQLERLGVVVPGSLLRAVRRDQILDAGNRLVEHRTDRPPTVLAG